MTHAGKQKLWSWVRPHALEIVCEVIGEEMDTIPKGEILPGISAITPDFIKSWMVVNVGEQAPFLTAVLLHAAQTSRAKENNKKKQPESMCNILVKQLSYHRSGRALGFPAQFGLFLWSSGCSRQTIEALHRCGLSLSYTSVLNNISSLADHCIQVAVGVGSGIHVFCYDNVQISTSIFVEQRGPSGPSKVTSCTFGLLYEVRNGNPAHMRLAPIMEHFRSVQGLQFYCDICPTDQQLSSVQFQLKIAIIQVLLKYCPVFQSYATDPTLQNSLHRPMPSGYVTKQFPLRATTIEEATVRGNLLYHDDVYHTQLGQAREDLSEFAVFQLGFGLFHLCLNLVWALLHVHRGSLSQTGSLSYFFALLEKTHLGGDHPDYHTLLSALIQILDSVLLNAWRSESGYGDLCEFAAAEPLAEDLLRISGDILLKHATPMMTLDPLNDKFLDDDYGSSDLEWDDDLYEGPSNTAARVPTVLPLDPDRDRAHQNLRLLSHDLLYVTELVRAISDGDIGRIEDMLPILAMMFQGAGSNNCCTEILHFIHNLKYVWMPEFA
ncbi:hypothetical protein EI94DRAFT_1583489 [Lactarius quietus]|nr:hypothetical protein EI94DRAFT_1583489 [Lactarius quietus]